MAAALSPVNKEAQARTRDATDSGCNRGDTHLWFLPRRKPSVFLSTRSLRTLAIGQIQQLLEHGTLTGIDECIPA
jgi:hypothetical protein